MKTASSIAQRLTLHLAGDGTSNDGETEELYREAHGLDVDAEIETEAIERWAFETVNRATRPAR
jgi:hypothetical protein